MNNIININNLSFGYSRQNTILENLSFNVTEGQFLAIAGPNGAGKTTILNLLCALLTPDAGSIEIDSADINSYSIKKLSQKIAVVRQESVPAFDFTVTEVVSMARTPYLPTFGFESDADKNIVTEAMKMTDTQQFAARTLAELSGGERQRVFIARAIAQDTIILLLDEPTSFLDLKHQVGIYDLLKQAQLQKNKTIIIITHDINLAAQYADKILLLDADKTYHIGEPKDVFNAELIEKVYGIKTFTCQMGREKFFVPMGNFARNVNNSTQTENDNRTK